MRRAHLYAHHASFAVVVVDVGPSLRIDADGAVGAVGAADPAAAPAQAVVDHRPQRAPQAGLRGRARRGRADIRHGDGNVLERYPDPLGRRVSGRRYGPTVANQSGMRGQGVERSKRMDAVLLEKIGAERFEFGLERALET